MSVTEEEVVTEKRAVVKEEIRVCKDVVEDDEVVEEDVRKEEVDVDDQAPREVSTLQRATGEREEGPGSTDPPRVFEKWADGEDYNM